MLANLVGLIVALTVGALVSAVIALFYILSQRKEYDEECTDLRRQVLAMQKPEFLTNMELPDMSERAKIRSEAEVRLIKECQGSVILAVRQALMEGQDSITLNLSRFPPKIAHQGLAVLDKDPDYSYKEVPGSQTYRITWSYGL